MADELPVSFNNIAQYKSKILPNEVIYLYYAKF